jgi:hypothetical protein
MGVDAPAHQPVGQSMRVFVCDYVEIERSMSTASHHEAHVHQRRLAIGTR